MSSHSDSEKIEISNAIKNKEEDNRSSKRKSKRKSRSRSRYSSPSRSRSRRRSREKSGSRSRSRDKYKSITKTKSNYKYSRKSSRSRSKSRSSRHKSPPQEKERTTRKKSKWSEGPEDLSEQFKLFLKTAPTQLPIITTTSISSTTTSTQVVSGENNLLTLGNSTNTNSSTTLTTNPLSLTDPQKFQRKIYIPKMQGVNFVGLLIGPKGTYQKRLEAQTNCKILIRGNYPNTNKLKEGTSEDTEEQHVLIIGDSEEIVTKAQTLIERILNADAETRNKIKEEQLKAAQELRSDAFGTDVLPEKIEDHLLTPYGPPDKNARILPVPNDCVGLIIGKNGDTIRRLHRETGCKIQIAKKEIPNTEVRNVFIEGPPEKYEFAKKMIEDIVAEQQRMKAVISNHGESNPFPGPYTKHKIPNEYIGLLIGKNGETIKNIHQKIGCFIYIPKDTSSATSLSQKNQNVDDEENSRVLELSGSEEKVQECIREIDNLITSALDDESLSNLPYDPNYLNAHNQYMQQQYGINMLTQSSYNNYYYNNTAIGSSGTNPPQGLPQSPNQTSSQPNVSATPSNINPQMPIRPNIPISHATNMSQSFYPMAPHLYPGNMYPYTSVGMGFNSMLPYYVFNNSNAMMYNQTQNQSFSYNSNFNVKSVNTGAALTSFPNVASNTGNISTQSNAPLLQPNQMIHINNYYNNTNQINNFTSNSTTQIPSTSATNNSTITTGDSKKKTDIKDQKKKETGGILNYIYGGQV